MKVYVSNNRDREMIEIAFGFGVIQSLTVAEATELRNKLDAQIRAAQLLREAVGTVGEFGPVSEDNTELEVIRMDRCLQCGYSLTPKTQNHCHFCGVSLLYPVTENES